MAKPKLLSIAVFAALRCGESGAVDTYIIGRAWSYTLKARGEHGVSHILDIMKKEMHVAMPLTGVNHAEEITSDILSE